MTWISVDERMPEDHQIVLATQCGGGGHKREVYEDRIWLARYQLESGLFWESWGYGQVHGVINWMELPEPPEDKP